MKVDADVIRHIAVVEVAVIKNLVIAVVVEVAVAANNNHAVVAVNNVVAVMQADFLN